MTTRPMPARAAEPSGGYSGTAPAQSGNSNCIWERCKHNALQPGYEKRTAVAWFRFQQKNADGQIFRQPCCYNCADAPMKPRANEAKKAETLAQIVESGLCVGRGLCQAIAGKEAIRFVTTPEGRQRPIQTRGIADEDWQAVLRTYPGTHVAGRDELGSTEGRRASFCKCARRRIGRCAQIRFCPELQ